jgi:hypothetical protein
VQHLLGWRDLRPLLPSIPAECSDPKKSGCISAWGFAEVIDSNVSRTEIGTQIFGFLLIRTFSLDMEEKLSSNSLGQFLEVSNHRECLLPIYNRYHFWPPNRQTLEIGRVMDTNLL